MVYADTMSRAREVQTRLQELEQRKMVTRVITEKVEYILSLRAEDGMTWGGTKGDLLELLHEVYVHGTILAPDGKPMTMTELVRRAFGVLGMTVMKNIAAHARRAEQRKGVRRQSIMARIRMILQQSDADYRLRKLWNEHFVLYGT